MRRLLVAGLLFMATTSTVALAQQYPPVSGNLTVNRTVVAPGSSVRVSGNNCASNAPVTLTLDGAPVAPTTADANGAFATTITIPTNASRGDHSLASSCASALGGTHVLGATVSVNTALPRTGSRNTIPILTLAAGLVVLGAVLVTAVRHRPDTT